MNRRELLIAATAAIALPSLPFSAKLFAAPSKVCFARGFH